MKKAINIFLLAAFIFVFVILPIISNARSGCCSHHGGVCGCGCCDGTSLSATCAPYYPQCNNTPPVNIVLPINTNTPTDTNSSANPSPNYNPVATEDNSGTTANGEDNNSTWLGLGVLGLGGAGIYYYIKNKK